MDLWSVFSLHTTHGVCGPHKGTWILPSSKGNPCEGNTFRAAWPISVGRIRRRAASLPLAVPRKWWEVPASAPPRAAHTRGGTSRKSPPLLFVARHTDIQPSLFTNHILKHWQISTSLLYVCLIQKTKLSGKMVLIYCTYCSYIWSGETVCDLMDRQFWITWRVVYS